MSILPKPAKIRKNGKPEVLLLPREGVLHDDEARLEQELEPDYCGEHATCPPTTERRLQKACGRARIDLAELNTLIDDLAHREMSGLAQIHLGAALEGIMDSLSGSIDHVVRLVNGNDDEDKPEPEPEPEPEPATEPSLKAIHRAENRLVASELRILAQAWIDLAPHTREAEDACAVADELDKSLIRADSLRSDLHGRIVNLIMGNWYRGGLGDREWEGCGLISGGSPNYLAWVEAGKDGNDTPSHDLEHARLTVVPLDSVEVLSGKLSSFEDED